LLVNQPSGIGKCIASLTILSTRPEGWFTNKLMTSFAGEPRGKEIFFGEDQTYQKS